MIHPRVSLATVVSISIVKRPNCHLCNDSQPERNPQGMRVCGLKRAGLEGSDGEDKAEGEAAVECERRMRREYCLEAQENERNPQKSIGVELGEVGEPKQDACRQRRDSGASGLRG